MVTAEKSVNGGGVEGAGQRAAVPRARRGSRALGAGLLTPPSARPKVSSLLRARPRLERETYGRPDGGVRRPAPSASVLDWNGRPKVGPTAGSGDPRRARVERETRPTAGSGDPRRAPAARAERPRPAPNARGPRRTQSRPTVHARAFLPVLGHIKHRRKRLCHRFLVHHSGQMGP